MWIIFLCLGLIYISIIILNQLANFQLQFHVPWVLVLFKWPWYFITWSILSFKVWVPNSYSRLKFISPHLHMYWLHREREMKFIFLTQRNTYLNNVEYLNLNYEIPISRRCTLLTFNFFIVKYSPFAGFPKLVCVEAQKGKRAILPETKLKIGNQRRHIFVAQEKTLENHFLSERGICVSEN